MSPEIKHAGCSCGEYLGSDSEALPESVDDRGFWSRLKMPAETMVDALGKSARKLRLKNSLHMRIKRRVLVENV